MKILWRQKKEILMRKKTMGGRVHVKGLGDHVFAFIKSCLRGGGWSQKAEANAHTPVTWTIKMSTEDKDESY